MAPWKGFDTAGQGADEDIGHQEVREREERERLTRHRGLLRIVTEFWLCGILERSG